MTIEVQHIRKQFGQFTALDDVSLQFADGELTALLGPSGCGKTTLLRIIAGLEFPDAGRVLLDGADASASHVRERQVGFVFQHYALFKHMTVFENVAFGLRVKPRKERPADVAWYAYYCSHREACAQVSAEDKKEIINLLMAGLDPDTALHRVLAAKAG